MLLPLNSPPPDGLDYGFGTDGPPKTYATCTGQKKDPNVGVVACLHECVQFSPSSNRVTWVLRLSLVGLFYTNVSLGLG